MPNLLFYFVYYCCFGIKRGKIDQDFHKKRRKIMSEKKWNVKNCSAYELVEQGTLQDLNSDSYILRHKKTGARVVLVSNDDENKVFYIGFRTPPVDSTGSAHIIEHSVLCGSKKFPVKDPFILLAKGSLNTFLNAMTYPDKTVYPLASCNDKDFQNLMHVYLDAVFYPNIYQEDKIFKQEGWHYEMTDIEEELILNGVVYNEMKGAFSSSDDVMEREVMNSLYPDTSYGFESGGDPDVIPSLTYEMFLDFHRKYYHPSNSYIYLYGNMDMEEKLNFIDEEYLSAFSMETVDSELLWQKPFEEMHLIEKSYSISEGEEEKDNTYLSINKVIGDNLDPDLYIAFEILDYALCSAPGAPLRQMMIDRGIGKDVYSIFEEGIKQPYFSVIAKNANYEQKQEFLDTYQEVLENLVKTGLDKKALYAAIHHYEFKHREADFGRYPKGLMYGLQMLDSWLHDESKPFIHVEANQTYQKLKDLVKTDYFEQLIQKYLLNNTHGSIVVLLPEKGLNARKDKEMADKLEAYKQTLSEEEKKRIVEETRALKEYQEQEDSPEALATIPHLTIDDLKKTTEPYINEELCHDGTKVLYHDIFTNGIGYVKWLFTMDDIPESLFPYVGILRNVIGLLNTEHYTYADYYNEVNSKTGGIGFSANHYVKADLSSYHFTMDVKTRFLMAEMSDAFALALDAVKYTKWHDYKRLKELLEETKSRLQSELLSAGHSTAMLRGMSYISEAAACTEELTSISQYRFVETLLENFENRKEELADNLEYLMKHIFRKEKMMIDYTGPRDGLEKLYQEIEKLQAGLFAEPLTNKEPIFKPVLEKKNEGFMTSSQVQYVSRVGNFIPKGLPYTGALRVLRVMLSYDYLWNNVRVKGGAYGCMCGFGRTGESYFVSYRDPNLEKTIDVYEQAAEYIRNFDGDMEEVTQYIIGAISELDIPKSPHAKGAYGLGGYLTGTTEEMLQQERDELLSVTTQGIQKLADYIAAFMEDECVCVIGKDEKIKEAKDTFGVTEQMFH